MPHSHIQTDALEQVKHYHQQTKHDFHRYAQSLGYMDWANQPDPFRRYESSPLFTLPLLTPEDEPRSRSYDSLYQHSGSAPQPWNFESLSRFFEYALSITAWKESGGTRWALRSNPSSGNLHPTEGYLVIGHTTDIPLEPGVYHYAPKEHGLEQRLRCSREASNDLLTPFPPETFLVGLSSIHWREAWKYGERAFRYCQHDIGHAIGTLRIAAATLGWQLTILSDIADAAIGLLLGLNRLQEFDQAEPEFPTLVAAVLTTHHSSWLSLPSTLEDHAIKRCSQGIWQGKANRLSRDRPISWEMIDTVTKASWKSSTETEVRIRHTEVPLTPTATKRERISTPVSAGHIIHQRRSALAFDGKTLIPVDRFFLMLERVLPQIHLPIIDRPMPWDSLPWNPAIHLALFVHRVDGLLPGLYMFLRNPDPAKKQSFQKSMHHQFVWKTPEDCPAHLPLYLLEEGNTENIAMQTCCGQAIAGNSAFALGMIAEFELALDENGPWFYRRLFWESGLIGQVLYLEAEAAQTRATGIGCFFDDPVHRVLGFPDARFQSLYHFTIGGPIEDQRLTTLPPYKRE